MSKKMLFKLTCHFLEVTIEFDLKLRKEKKR